MNRRLVAWLVGVSLAAWWAARIEGWPSWAVGAAAVAVLACVAVPDLVRVHRHFGWPAALCGLAVVHGAALIALATADPRHAVAIVAIACSAAAVCIACKVVLERSPDRWLARTFDGLPPDALMAATRGAEWRGYRPGDVVVAEGEEADRFYFVTRGVAEVTQVTPTGETHLHTHERGEFFGELGLLTSVPRTATVRAVSNLEVVALDRTTFELLVSQSATTADQMMSVALERKGRPDPGEDAVPLPPWSRLLRRMFRHPRAMHYNRLIAVVMAVNAVVAGYGAASGWWTSEGTELEAVAVVAQANFAFALVFRQQYVINALAWLATRPPTSWPLRIRWALGKYYHFGGLHAGGAVAGTLWYAAFVASLAYDLRHGADVSVANLVVTSVIVVLFAVMVVLATPRLRAAQHDRFEVTHRFFGWAALVLVWVNTVLFVASRRGDRGLADELLGAPSVWILVVATAFAAWPWLLLRRVPITIEQPSSHAVIVKLDHGVTPGIGTTRPISRQPLIGWHHFANVPAAPGTSGYRMVVSRAGDWTSVFIDDPPSHVWIRGIPTMGVANVRKLFKKVVLVATGSGIGPMLGHLLDQSVPSRLVWVTRNPRRTYGDQLIDEIEAAQPDAIIWDTDQRGKPDVLRLAYGAYLSSGAEAVVCIANRVVTWQVVHGLERRGIPAFGPIWDS